MPFSLISKKKKQHVKLHESQPLHLISVAAIPCENLNTKKFPLSC